MAETVIGVLSDTHGLLRLEAVQALQGVAHILHAGDVGDPDVLSRLGEIAPVTAVRGNCDRDPWAAVLGVFATVDIAGARFFMLHDLYELARHPGAGSCHVIVTGHTHRPSHEIRDGVHYLNPGSAGPRRFNLPVTLARVRLGHGEISAELLELA